MVREGLDTIDRPGIIFDAAALERRGLDVSRNLSKIQAIGRKADLDDFSLTCVIGDRIVLDI